MNELNYEAEALMQRRFELMEYTSMNVATTVAVGQRKRRRLIMPERCLVISHCLPYYTHRFSFINTINQCNPRRLRISDLLSPVKLLAAHYIFSWWNFSFGSPQHTIYLPLYPMNRAHPMNLSKSLRRAFLSVVYVCATYFCSGFEQTNTRTHSKDIMRCVQFISTSAKYAFATIALSFSHEILKRNPRRKKATKNERHT